MIVKKIYDKLKNFKSVKIKRLVIGLGYTAALTEHRQNYKSRITIDQENNA